MEVRIAKEYLHLQDWLAKAARITATGLATYDSDDLLREAGDSLMMKIGEAANRLQRLGEADPECTTWQRITANRNWLIHQYDYIDRSITWATLATSLPELESALSARFDQARSALNHS